MLSWLSILFILVRSIGGSHFNGGTITWAPIDPFDNSSSVTIAIKQSYSWSYPTVLCNTSVPISTPAYSGQNTNLTCVANCSTDGGYSQKPIDILTDCVSTSSSLGVMSTERTVNITLNSSAYFYIANQGSSWRSLNDPSQSGLPWSILSLINLVRRTDGRINTPPVASVFSPQYVVVNTTTDIKIPVSDANGDDVRCRWSIYRPGFRRRRDIDSEEIGGRSFFVREKRQGCSGCNSGTCATNCPCSCPDCVSSTCNGSTCLEVPSCQPLTTTIATTLTTFVNPPLDECGGICHTNGLPNDTTLANCTVSFTGLVPGAWYAVALQVEDFINSTSTTAMSSVPVQFLIYVLPISTCTVPPLILPLTDCFEVQVGQSITFTLTAMDRCNTTATITDILVVQTVSGLTGSTVVNSTTNSSLASATFTWTPRATQVGVQQLCFTAFNNLFLQSTQYCVTFNVTSTTPKCRPISAVTTSMPAKSTADINVALIVGLSLLGLLLSICLLCCLLYHLLWSAAARRRRREKRARPFLQHKDLPTFSSLSVPQNPDIKRPKTNYVVHNITDRRESTYTCRSSMPTVESSIHKPRHSVTMSTRSNHDSSLGVGSAIKESFVTKSAPPRNQKPSENTLSPSSARRGKNISKVSPKIERQIKEDDVPPSPRVRVKKLPRKQQLSIPEATENEVKTMNSPSISSARSSTTKQRGRNPTIDVSSDNEDGSQRRSSRIGTVRVRKLKRLSQSVQPMQDHHDQSPSKNNHVKVTAVKKK